MIFIQAIVLLIVLGIVWYFVEPYVKDPFKPMVIIVSVLGFCLWLLDKFDIVHLSGLNR